jgi:ABC-type Zn uptake system ZnuABC Zn-binding protein ZnuA
MLAPKRLVAVGLIVMALAVVLGTLAGCGKQGDPWPPGASPRIVVSFPPLYSFVKNVAGDDAAVVCLLKNEGPHGYEYRPRDVLLLRRSDVFFANGLGLDDHFTDRMSQTCNNSALRYVKLGDECIQTSRRIEVKEGQHLCCNHGHHHNSGYDPHIWLGLDEAIDMVQGIARELGAFDPPQAAAYNQRAGDYVRKLEALKEEGRKQLAEKDVKLVTVHGSLGYFSRTFGLSVVGSIQFQPGDEPNSARLRDLIKLCVEKQVRLIAVEPQYPENAADALLRVLEDRGVRSPRKVIVDPLETADPDDLDATWYERKMSQNIRNLAEALE